MTSLLTVTSTFGHEPKDLKDGCKKVQYCVYAHVAEEIMKKVDKSAVVSKSGYFFFSEKGMAKGGGGTVFVEKALWPDWKIELSSLLDTIGEGKFFVGKEPGCKFCDYKEICDITEGDEKGGAIAATKRKLEGPEEMDESTGGGEAGEEKPKAVKK